MNNKGLGIQQQNVLAALKRGPMLTMDFGKREQQTILSLQSRGLITRWQNQWGQKGWQLTTMQQGNPDTGTL